MSYTTQGTLLLTRLGIAFELHPYNYDPNAPRIGLHAAAALGLDPSQVFKTLMAQIDGKPVCVVIPSDTEVSMKKLAAACGGRSAAMMTAPDAERLTGYKVGGIGPFGQKRKVPVRLDETAELYDAIYVNAGQRGLLLSLAPADAVMAAEMVVADLTA